MTISPAFSPFAAIFGGLLLAIASLALLYFDGRIAGVSGITWGIASRDPGERPWRMAFVAGLLVGGAILRLLRPASFEAMDHASLPLLAVAGVLVGVGTRLANGCTSGHGVSGLARRSPRSLAATGTFMVVAFATVFVTHHVLGVSR